jgi:serine protease
MPVQRYLATTTLLLPLALALASCGGGGGGGSGTAPAAPDSGASGTFSVSGSLLAAAASRVDGDVNDPNAVESPNNTAGTAQALPNPVRLGGYLTAEPTNRPDRGDRFANSTDTQDWYRLSLDPGQVVEVAVGDWSAAAPAAIAFSLELYADDGVTLLESDSAAAARLAVAAPDSASGVAAYRLRVGATSGGSAYVLSAGLSLAAARDPFVPGEAVVAFQAPVGAQALSPAGVQAVARDLRMQIVAGAQTGGPVRLRFDPMDPGTRSAVGLSALSAPAADANRGALLHAETLSVISALRARADVRLAEPNYLRRRQLTPNDPYYTGGAPAPGLLPLQQWHYNLINLPAAWDRRTTGDVIVAVVDSGIATGHPDFAGRTVPGYDFVSVPELVGDGGGIDDDPTDPDATSGYHGTHVAGTVAAATNNALGVAGVAWDAARVMPLRALGVDGLGSTYDIVQAVRYAAGLSNDSGGTPTRRADIINLSLGGGTPSAFEQETFDAVRAEGVLVIAAAGNSATSTPAYPASYSGVVSVSAVTSGSTLASYSNRGASVDVAAPGGQAPNVVWSAWRAADGSDGYAGYQGTSMAAPHVAGVAALMKAENPGLSPDGFDCLLASELLTNDLAPAGRDDNFGYGLIDADLAVARAASSTGPILKLATSVLQIERSASAAEVSVGNPCDGNTTVTNVTTSTDDGGTWLSVDSSLADATTGLGTYGITVNRSGLADGLYSGTVRFEYSTDAPSTGAEELTVLAEVLTSSNADAAGFHYVLLVGLDVAGDQQDSVAVANGRYDFSFGGAASGDYLLLGGSDLDNDFFICDAGEACAYYPTRDAPAALSVSGNRTGLSFETSFELPPSVGSTGFSRADPGTGR